MFKEIRDTEDVFKKEKKTCIKLWEITTTMSEMKNSQHTEWDYKHTTHCRRKLLECTARETTQNKVQGEKMTEKTQSIIELWDSMTDF